MGPTSGRLWATGDETANPWDLCRALTFSCCHSPPIARVMCAAASFAKQEESIQALRATTSIQPRRWLPRMVSEFREIFQWPVDKPLPRKLSAPFQGWVASAGTDTGVQSTERKLRAELLTLGIHRSPQEFIHEALCAGQLK